jgi:predicted ArsR family transcriptional regulator
VTDRTLPLWDGYPPSQPVDTSEEAADDIVPAQGRLQHLVLGYVALRAEGATQSEVSAGLGLSAQTTCPRLWELCKAGLLRMSEDARKTPSGRWAHVYRATWLGLRRLRQT